MEVIQNAPSASDPEHAEEGAGVGVWGGAGGGSDNTGLRQQQEETTMTHHHQQQRGLRIDPTLEKRVVVRALTQISFACTCIALHDLSTVHISILSPLDGPVPGPGPGSAGRGHATLCLCLHIRILARFDSLPALPVENVSCYAMLPCHAVSFRFVSFRSCKS